jgi:hypothetical protein
VAEGDSHVKATQPRHDCNFGGDLIVTVEGRHSGRRTVGANPHVHPDAEGRPRGRTGGICGPYGEQSGLKQQRPKHPQRENDLLAVPGTFLRTPGEAPEARLHPGSRTDQPGLRRSEHVSESRDCPWPRIGPAACTEPSPIRIPCRVASVLTVSGPSSPFLQDGKEGQRAGFPAIFLVALSARRVTMRRLHVVDGSGATAASARAASNV